MEVPRRSIGRQSRFGLRHSKKAVFSLLAGMPQAG